MISVPLNNALSDEIRRCMRGKKIPQKKLAEMLGWSVPDVSKLVRGKLIPSQEEIESILSCLNPDAATQKRLRQLAARLNTGLVINNQNGNSYFRCLREKRGLTLPMLSNRTGIKTSRLTEIENSDLQTATEAEQQILNRVLLEVASSKGNEYDRQSSPEPAIDLSSMSLPLLHLADFEFYDWKKPLSELVQKRSREKIFWELHTQNSPAAVLADCRQLQLSFPGFAVLAISDMPRPPLHRLELRCDKKGYFALYELCNGEWFPSCYCSQGAVFNAKRWCLPVYDLVFKPFELTIG